MSQENVEVVRRLVEGRWKRPEFEPLEYIDAGGDCVIFVARLVTQVSSPEHVPDPAPRVWCVFRVADRSVVDWRPYPSEQAARKAVGLSEQDAHADS
jgi:hypothetical protein